MTDLELTKACAKKIGLTVAIDARNDAVGVVQAIVGAQYAHRYNPLNDDAQAMALVKRFRLYIQPQGLNKDILWLVSYAWGIKANVVHGDDLNRAIVECVAKIPKSA